MNASYLLTIFSVACEGVHARVCVRVTGAHVVFVSRVLPQPVLLLLLLLISAVK